MMAFCVAVLPSEWCAVEVLGVPKKQYGFLISEELANGLKILKERDGTPESETIRRALAQYLESKGVMSKKAMQQRRTGASRRIGLPKSE